MSKVIFAQRLNISTADKETFKKAFIAFEKKYPQEHTIREPRSIDIERNVFAYWACIWNKPEYINKDATPIAQKEQYTIVQFKDNFISIYRNEDLDQNSKEYDNGTTQTTSSSAE